MSTQLKPLRGIAAVHYFAAEASMRGYIPLLTVRNTEGFDIALVNPSTKKSINIQVKANSKKTDYWFVGKKTAEYLHVLVVLSGNSKPVFYFVPHDVVNKKKRSDTARSGNIPDYRYLREADISHYKEKWELAEQPIS